MNGWLLEIRCEFLKALRMPAYSLPTILFPLVFYVFFGIVLGLRTSGPVTMAAYLIATYGAFGVIGASLFGFGVTVAVERGQGWMEAKRTTPMPIAAYFVAKLAMAAMFSSIIVALLMLIGTAFGGVTLETVQIAQLMAVFVPGSVTFCALGLALGFFAGPNSAAAVVNLVYLPMSILSGLWVPIAALPKNVQEIALWLPPYHLSQLALKVIGASRGDSPLLHVAFLAGSAVLFLAVAWIGYRLDEGKTYG